MSLNNSKQNRPKKSEPLADVILQLYNRVEKLENQILFEEHLRKEHPALQKAWEKYTLIKKIIK